MFVDSAFELDGQARRHAQSFLKLYGCIPKSRVCFARRKTDQVSDRQWPRRPRQFPTSPLVLIAMAG